MTAPRYLARLSGGSAGHDGVTVLRDLELVIPAGSLTVVTGSNGSGKSTLLAVLAGLKALDTGTLQLVTGTRRAFVPQRSAARDTLPLTVADVVGMGRWSRRGRPDRHDDRSITAASIRAVGLAGSESRSLAELSGGQRQRALLAQGLAQRADLLLLDEPAAGLDAAGSIMLAQCIATEQSRGAAVVVVTHDPVDALTAPRTIHVENGRAVFSERRSFD